jgi:hypothetical protein
MEIRGTNQNFSRAHVHQQTNARHQGKGDAWATVVATETKQEI